MQPPAGHPAPSEPIPTPAKRVSSPHFYTLDIVRAVAALIVVVFHWKHFGGEYLRANDGIPLPWENLLKSVYSVGYRAVDLFFALSGFIFYWLYSEKVASGKITGWNFGALRFSRLYPLHFVTLCFVGIMQFIILRLHGSFFVYPNNRLNKFIEHLFFASDWGQGKLSFNGPAWSVSVEVFLYALFFIVCRLNLRRWWMLVGFALAGYALEHIGFGNIGHAAFSFFAGGIVCVLFNRLSPRLKSPGLNFFVIGCVAAWIVLPAIGANRFFFDAYSSHFGSRLFVHGKDLIGAVLLTASQNIYTAMLYPLTVLTLALNDTRWSEIGRRLAPFGNISYSSYLLHFPLQLVFLFVVLISGLSPSVLLTPAALILFLIILVPLAFLSYYKFEHPLQNLLRSRLISRPKT